MLRWYWDSTCYEITWAGGNIDTRDIVMVGIAVYASRNLCKTGSQNGLKILAKAQ
jgi:hypothetical protein